MKTLPRFANLTQALVAILVLLLALVLPTYAAPYGGATYGECRYSETSSCPTGGAEEPESETEGNQVGADIDGDGEDEFAIDDNNDLDDDNSDGYEVFDDPDGSSEVTDTVDGDDDGMTDYLIDTDSDGDPDVYWDPDDGILITIVNQAQMDVDGDGDLECAFDYNDDMSDGFEVFLDPDGSTTVVYTLDGDGDGMTDYMLDIDGDGQADVYWDPDDGILSTVVYCDCDDDDDDDGEVSFNNGDDDYYYDVDTTEVVLISSPASPPQQPDDSDSRTRLTGAILGTGGLYDFIGDFLENIPKPVAVGFPYFLLLVLLLIILKFGIQARREAKRASGLVDASKREQALVDQKKAFVQLYSHHMRTPLTKMVGGVDLAITLAQKAGTNNTAQLVAAQTTLKSLSETINGLVGSVETNQNLNAITDQNLTKVTVRAYTSWLFWLPLVLLIFMAVVAKFLLIDFRITDPNVFDILGTIAFIILGAQQYFSHLRKRQIARATRMEEERLSNGRSAVDESRNTAIAQSAEEIGKVISSLPEPTAIFKPEDKSLPIYQQGLTDLRTITARFALIQALKVSDSKAPLETISPLGNLRDVASKFGTDKVIMQENGAQDLVINSRQSVFNVVATSIIENAVKHNGQGAAVQVIPQGVNGNNYAYTVKDNGPGIPQDQIQKLFQPFSRATSTEVYEESGVGLGLYLARLAAEYLGGSISIESGSNGTSVTIALPTNVLH